MNKQFLVIVFVLSLFVFLNQPSVVSAQKPVAPPDVFVGEQLDYDVGYWIFPRALKTRVNFDRHEKGYVSEFDARTAGVVRLFAGDRRGSIRSVMVYDADAQRLKPLFFEEVFSSGKRVWRKELFFDYENRKYTLKRINPDGDKVNIVKNIPRETFDDILSAFFNFRMGYFGKIEEKKEFGFSVLVKEALSRVDIVFDGTEKQSGEETVYHSEVSVERDISYLGTNRLSLWFSKDRVPVNGVVKNAYFFGDLTLKLIENGVQDD